MKKNTSCVVESCQVCESPDLKSALFLGYLPPVNTMPRIGSRPAEQSGYPAEVLYCKKCQLVQIGLVVDPEVLFPAEYPYTSSTTKILRDNFAELAQECKHLVEMKSDDLVLDIGSNDGNLLRNFKDQFRVVGITPEDIGKLAVQQGIPTIQAYFGAPAVDQVLKEFGSCKIVTATNVFAHIDNIHSILTQIMRVLKEDGVFISESHYLVPLIETLQYDTVYHEHLRYYSLHSLKYLLEMHGLEVFHTKEIPTHGGSIRVYASRKGKFKVRDTVQSQLKKEVEFGVDDKRLQQFRTDVIQSKLELMALLKDIKQQGKKIYGISAPSRASTLINYVGIDDGIVDYVLEAPGSHKIGKYVPGTLIPVVDEKILYEHQPEYALLFSWHIASELIPKLKQKGFKGKFIVPLPTPKVVSE